MLLIKQTINTGLGRKCLACFYRMLLRVQMDRCVLSKREQVGSGSPFPSSPNKDPVWRKQIIRPVFIFVFLTLSLNLFPPPSAEAVETIITLIYLNEEQKGEYFLRMTTDQDFLVKAEDLKEMGLPEPKGKAFQIEGISYLSLKSMANITFYYDENKQALKIQSPPELLGKTNLNFAPGRQKNVLYPKENSVFFNYGLNYGAGNGFKFDSFSGTSQLGGRIGDFLFLSDSVLMTSDKETRFNRLMSSIIYDRRDRKDMFVLGDFNAQSGNLGSSLVLGGLSYSKNYSSDPGFIKRPVFDYQGYVNLPSEVTTYLNGVRLRSEKIAPGGFNLQNILGYSGSQDLDIVIKDAFGREQHFANPFYVSEPLLAKGLHDYSYNIGYQRRNIGVDGDQYSDLTFMGSHRYGVTNALTLGLRGEATSDLYNVGSQLSYANNFGSFEMTLANSQGKEKQGFAGSASYSYQGKGFGARLSVTEYTEDYATLATAGAPKASVSADSSLSILSKPKTVLSAGLSYGTQFFGSVGLSFNKTIAYNNQERQLASLMYSRNLGKNASITFSLNQTAESGMDNNKTNLEFMIGLYYYPWKDIYMSNTGRSGDNLQGSFQIQRTAPDGEGYGYRASVDVTGDEKNNFTTKINPYLQYNGRYGVYTSEFSAQHGGVNDQMYQFTASGAIVYVGKTVMFSRPVSDSFAIVQVGQVPGVRVYSNNQEAGRTNTSGKVVLPFPSYEETQVRINDKDIPLNYALTNVNRFVSPSLRSGSFIKFEAKKVQAFTGMLKFIKNGKKLPIEYQLLTMQVEGKTATFQTGKGGEFFIEDVLPGTYRATFKFNGKLQSFEINIPKSDDIIIDAGEIHVEIQS